MIFLAQAELSSYALICTPVELEIIGTIILSKYLQYKFVLSIVFGAGRFNITNL